MTNHTALAAGDGVYQPIRAGDSQAHGSANQTITFGNRMASNVK
ncbi:MULTISPECIES: hypothetical protein [unclassified Streptomyces]|nr:MULTISPECIES: hypothetical protein [unclassified Streptomyces]